MSRASTELIRLVLEPSGILVATIDMPDRKLNVFSLELMDALDAVLHRVENDPAVQAVVLTSGKSTFLAGADLTMVRGFTESAKTATREELRELCGRLGRQFVRLEASVKPWIAAVNGLVLGGGLELALACRARLVTDDPRTQIGVPEVRWGLLPGAGGTQRLPRLAGFEPGMALLLGGTAIAPAEAVRLGIFARAVPGAELLDAARETAKSMIGQAYDQNVKFSNAAQVDVPPRSDATRLETAARHGVSVGDLSLYPAYGAIIESVLEGARLPLGEATEVEMSQFLTLMQNPVAGRMVRTLYLDRIRGERALPLLDAPLDRLETGELGTALGSWREALAKVKLPQAVNVELPADSLALVDAAGLRYHVSLRELGALDESRGAPAPWAVLSAVGPYGRVLEIVGATDGAAAALASLAVRMSAFAWRTPGPTSVLGELLGRSLPEQATLALARAAHPGAGEPAFLNVAACFSGVSPAWSGGPLTFLWAERSRLLSTLNDAGLAAFTRLEPALRETCS